MLNGIERSPDYTIVGDDSGKTWYWERKLAAYRQEGILPLAEGVGKNGTSLITEEKEGIGLDACEIMKNIEAILGK